LTFSLVAIDIIAVDRPDNPLGFPPNVNFNVRITQLIAIVISVVTQDDIRTSLNLIYDGYRRDNFRTFEGASHAMWAVSVACRFLEGSLGLIVTFCLIMPEKEVVELLLNFTAMEFVFQLDEAMFFLATQGYLGASTQKKAETVLSSVYFIHKKASRRMIVTLLLAILGLLLLGWGLVTRQQQSGEYLCNLVFVQFSDQLFVPALGTFSGLYTRTDPDNFFLSGYPINVENRSSRANFMYCEVAHAWIFSMDSKVDPCDDWVAISEETFSFDLIETSNLDWFVITSDNFAGLVPIQYFQMDCYDCA
jgi:hypothetical protein